ncbi:MAG: endonuclease/exonuclease/phosphatase family protein [Pseudomonadota bacterium]
MNTELERNGPGLFLRDILRDEADIIAAAQLIARSQADVVVLQGLDWDHGQAALSAFRQSVNGLGGQFDTQFTLVPNAGKPTSLDLDGDGYLRGAADAEGFGAFPGQGGMAVLSRWPVELEHDFTDLVWSQMPDTAILANDPGFEERRLSSFGHWVLRVTPDDAKPFTVMAFHASPPVFDGPEDLNGRRNRDETLLWVHLLDGRLNAPPPKDRFAVAGVANADPFDGDARRDGIHALLRHKAIQDTRPRDDIGRHLAVADGGVNTKHAGDPAMDTANWSDDGPGNLRVDYVLPSADWRVAGSGILWAEPDEDGIPALRHGLVWVDVAP